MAALSFANSMAFLHDPPVPWMSFSSSSPSEGGAIATRRRNRSKRNILNNYAMIESIGDRMPLEKRRDAGFFPKCKLSLEPKHADQYMRTHTSGFQTPKHPAKLKACAMQVNMLEQIRLASRHVAGVQLSCRRMHE